MSAWAAIEMGGRIAEELDSEIRWLAKQRAQRKIESGTADPSAVRRATLKSWREQLSVTLQQGDALSMMAILGDDQQVQLGGSREDDSLDLAVLAAGGG